MDDQHLILYGRETSWEERESKAMKNFLLKFSKP
jgi:hypothetical protein